MKDFLLNLLKENWWGITTFIGGSLVGLIIYFSADAGDRANAKFNDELKEEEKRKKGKKK